MTRPKVDLKPLRSPRLRTTVGLVLCTVSAAVTAVLTHTSDAKTAVPLAFVAVIIVFAMMYGLAVGVVGTLLSAAVFAYLLFPPRGSVIVSNEGARANLAWMMAAGISLSFLLVAPKER